VTSGIPTK